MCEVKKRNKYTSTHTRTIFYFFWLLLQFKTAAHKLDDVLAVACLLANDSIHTELESGLIEPLYNVMLPKQ